MRWLTLSRISLRGNSPLSEAKYLDNLDQRILTLLRSMGTVRAVDVANQIGYYPRKDDEHPGTKRMLDKRNYNIIYTRLRRLYRLGILSMTQKARYTLPLGPISGPYKLKPPVNVVPVPTSAKEAALMTKQDRVLVALAVADEPLHIKVVRELVGIPYNQTTAILSTLFKAARVYKPERGYYRITSGPSNDDIMSFVRDNRF